MIRKILLNVSLIASGLMLVSTFPAQKISYDNLDATNFSNYRTYTWKRAEKSSYPGDQVNSILTRAVDKQMAAKGFSRVDGDTADVYLVYQLAVLDDALYSSFNTNGQWQGGGANSVAIFTGGTTNSASFIKVGWLILEMYEVARKKQVWQVSAKKTLGETNDPNKMQKNADKVMAKIFKEFPKR